MTLYALVKAGAIVQTGNLPAVWYDGARWWDLRGATDTKAAQAGWLPVVDTPRPADTATTTTDYSVTLVTGKPTVTWTSRARTTDEISADARLDDLTARVERLEAAVWPAPPTPTTTTGIKTFADWGGVVPAGGLVLDGGVVYRNVSGVPLTTAPSGFPPPVTAWAHLWAPVLDPTPPPTAPAWAEGVAYKVGDRVTYSGTVYQCAQAHTSQAGWTPPAVPALWTVA